MRLIDVDYLKSILNSSGGESVNININKSMPLGDIVDIVISAYRECLFAELEKVPTAYDVNKVVEQLEEKSKQYENPASGNKEFVQYCKGIFTGYKYAIDDMKEIGRGQQA